MCARSPHMSAYACHLCHLCPVLLAVCKRVTCPALCCHAVRRGCSSLAVNGVCLASCRLAPSVAQSRLSPSVSLSAMCSGTPRRSSKLPLNPQTGLPHWPQIIRIRSASLVWSAVGASCGAPCALTLSRPPWWLSVVLCYTSLSQIKYNALADRLRKSQKNL